MTQQEIPTSEVLNLAADLIEERGWAKGIKGMLVTGPHCVQGAIQAAVGCQTTNIGMGEQYLYLDHAPCAAGSAVAAYLNDWRLDAAPAVHPLEFLYVFNDTSGRTAAEVIEVLRATALIEQARETANEHARAIR